LKVGVWNYFYINVLFFILIHKVPIKFNLLSETALKVEDRHFTALKGDKKHTKYSCYGKKRNETENKIILIIYQVLYL